MMSQKSRSCRTLSPSISISFKPFASFKRTIEVAKAALVLCSFSTKLKKNLFRRSLRGKEMKEKDPVI